jgi:hypothetical protein
MCKIDEKLNENCDATCRAEMLGSLDSIMEDVKTLLDLHREDPGGSDYDLGSLETYGLEFVLVDRDEIDPNTVTFKWLIGTGGPHYEFQIKASRQSEYDYRFIEVRYVVLPWFQRGEIVLDGPYEAVLESVFLEYFVEYGIADSAFHSRPYYY